MINNMQNPYMFNQMPNYQPQTDWQRINQINQYVRGFPQQSMPMGLPGKFIKSPNDVVVSEVPQDGSVAFFPTTDFKKIYAKAWTSDGKIQTEEYVLRETSEDVKPNFQNDILARLDRIEEMLSTPKRTTKRNEVDKND